MQILGETTGKVIIWANYIHDINTIESAIKKEFGPTSYCTYYGATKQEDRQACINKFQDETNPVRFFIGNTQTGGYGITLTQASTVIYYSNNYDLEKRIQSEDRYNLGCIFLIMFSNCLDQTGETFDEEFADECEGLCGV